jgi:hypothetical protein
MAYQSFYEQPDIIQSVHKICKRFNHDLTYEEQKKPFLHNSLICYECEQIHISYNNPNFKKERFC